MKQPSPAAQPLGIEEAAPHTQPLQPEPPFSAHTRLPTEHGLFDMRVLVDEAGSEHLALSVGELSGAEDVLVRVHSECITSEVFGSLKCDCKAQLEEALRRIQREGRGLVCYLRQEGRGIGLTNKIRAYALQSTGVDTVDANRMLGLPDDLRHYESAVEMIQSLGIRSVRMLTNNPSKIESLQQLGVQVNARQPIVVGVNPVNHDYLVTKHDRMGHLYSVQEIEQAEAYNDSQQKAI